MTVLSVTDWAGLLVFFLGGLLNLYTTLADIDDARSRATAPD